MVSEQEFSQLRNLVNQHIGFRPSLPTASVPHVDKGFFLKPTDFVANIGSPTLSSNGGSSNEAMAVWALDASSVEVIVTNFVSDLPSFTVTFFLVFNNTGTGDVSISYTMSTYKEGASVTSANGPSEAKVVSAPGVANLLTVVRFTPKNFPLKESFIRFGVQRNATNGNDTYASDVLFLGALIQ